MSEPKENVRTDPPGDTDAAQSSGSTPEGPSASSEADRALIRKALGGDTRAFDQLVDKHRGGLRRHIYRLLNKPAEIDDLVQDCFVKAYRNLDRYDPQYAFSTWLYRIATNHTIDFLRKRRLKTFSIDRPVATKDGEMQMELPDWSNRPDGRMVDVQRNAILDRAIEALPEKYHRVIVMRHKQEMAYEEIAEALDVPLGTVKAHIFRARALLYKALKDQRDSL